MTTPRRKSLPHLCLITLFSATALTLAVSAQAAWPEKPVRIVVPSSPGGSADAVARLLGDRLSRALKQPVIIENKGGGGGNIATDIVAKAAADGYTLLLTGNNHTINISLFNPPPYKLDDFTPVIELTRGPSVFVAAKNAPFSTLRGMISAAKAHPNSIAYGGPGIGLPSHIAFEMFEHTTGIQMIHAPYKGSGPSLSDALGGQIPVVTSTLAAAMPHVKAGNLHALAVTSAERWPSLPDVPTVAEIIGIPFQHLTWLGILAPKGTPDSIVQRLNAELNKGLQEQQVQTTLDTLGTHAIGGSSTTFQQMIQDEAVTSKALVQRIKLSAH